MINQEPIRIFIGSGEASLLERKVAIYSLRKHSKRNLDIYVFNGSHNSIELNEKEPFLAPLPLHLKYRNVTEFSLYRYLIPQLCDYQGKAIYIDSDIISLTDIGELFETPLNGNDFLSKADAYSHRGERFWALSVKLIDCETCRFDLENYYKEIDKGLYTNADFSSMSPTFLAYHPLKIGTLNPQWNVFDYYDRETKLIHYTNLYTQPWKSSNHRYGELWFTYFQEAIDAGYITQDDIDLSIIRSYVRKNIRRGNSPSPDYKDFIRQKIHLLKNLLRKEETYSQH